MAIAMSNGCEWVLTILTTKQAASIQYVEHGTTDKLSPLWVTPMTALGIF